MPNEGENSGSAQDNGATNNELARITTKIPPFWTKNPALWFAQMDSQFINKGVTSEKTKYHTIVSTIESEIAAQVSDIILNPPPDAPYTALKERLLERFADSEEKRLKKLLSEVELGDRLPSHLLREMKELAGTKVNDDLMKSLWLQRLPQQTQAILSVSSELLSKQAAMADKIYQVADRPNEACSIASSSSSGTIQNLRQEVSVLTRKIEQLMQSNGRNGSRSSSRQRSQSRSRARSRSASQAKQYDTCWYHYKFKEQAKKCNAPCKFRTSEN